MAEAPARARLVRAMYQLAVGTGSLQERVAAAWVELLPLQRGDFPAALAEAFGGIEAEMLTAPDDPAAISDEAAIAAADRIFRLAVALWGG